VEVARHLLDKAGWDFEGSSQGLDEVRLFEDFESKSPKHMRRSSPPLHALVSTMQSSMHVLYRVGVQSPLALAAVEAAERLSDATNPSVGEASSNAQGDATPLRLRPFAAANEMDLGAPELAAISAYLNRAGDARTLVGLLRSSGAHVRVGKPGADPAAEAAAQEAQRKYAAAKAAWRQEMEARSAHREYRGLVSDVRREEESAARAETFALYGQQLSVGMSLLLVLFSAALLGYFAGRMIYPDDPTKVRE
jgi:hypothetical protein